MPTRVIIHGFFNRTLGPANELLSELLGYYTVIPFGD